VASPSLFEQIRDEIPGATAAVVGSIGGGGLQSEAWGALDPNPVSAHLRGLVEAWDQCYRDLGGAVDFGSNDEVLISASRGYLLIKVHHDSGKFVGVFLSADGNIGYLRFRMRDYLRRAMA
jgi:predicted regulator of Ras-like GTPase activity (Roadblock/LC7/MglB family)